VKGSGRTGRRPGASGSRDKILSAARAVFSAQGYNAATMKKIARHAGCDAALIHHFFGTKRELFDEAITLPYDPGEVLVSFLSGERREGLGTRLMEFVLSRWETGESRGVLLALLRSASSEQDAREAVHDLLVRRALLPSVRAMGVPDAERRAALIGALFVGLMIVRHVVRMEPIASDSRERLARALGPVIEHYLFDDLEHDALQ
jgi:AcrR family transcriptional regulator